MERNSVRTPSVLVALALSVTGACASTVVDAGARAVQVGEPRLDWRAAEAADLAGLYASERLEGEAAAALWKLYYHFAPEGLYTGAALVFDGERARFQTLSGSWSLAGGRLDLDGAAAGSAALAGDLLRIESEAGVAVFRRVPIH